jgi:hypothetical protein
MVKHNMQQDLSAKVLYTIDIKDAYPSKYTEFVVGPLVVSMMLMNCFLYGVIIFKFRAVTRRTQTTSAREERSRRLTSTVVLVVVITLSFWGPIVFFFLLPRDIRNPSQYAIRSAVYRISFVLVIASSYLNNVIYALRQPDYRMAFRRLLRLKTSSVSATQFSDSTAA